MKSENDKYLDIASKAFRIVLTAILVLIPWIIFPLSFEFYDSAKSVFFIIASAFLLVLLAIKIILKKKLSFARNPLDLFMIFWLLISVISTVLSMNPETSIWGYYSRYTGGLLLNIFLVIFYFTIVNGIDSKEDYEVPVKGFVFSITIFSLFLVIQYINGYIGILNPIYDMLGERIGFINSDFFKINSFNTIGTSSLIPITLLILLPIISNNYFTENSKTSLFSSMINVLSIAISASALVGHLKLVVPVLFVLMMSIYVYFYSEKLKEILPKVILLGMIFTISFLFFNIDFKNNFGIRNYEVNSFLSLEESINVSTGSFRSGAKNAIIGSGPDTFALNFSKYKSIEYNDTEYWNLRYSKAGSQLFEELNNQGALGVISISLIGISMIVFVFRRIILSKIKDTKVDIQILGFGIVPLLLAISSIFVFFNFFLWFLFFTSTAIVVGAFYYLNPEKANKFEIIFTDENRVDYIIPQLLLSVVTVLLVVVTLVLGKNYYSDIKLREGINNANKAALAHELQNYEAECAYYQKAYDSVNTAFTGVSNKDYIAKNYSLISFNFGVYLFNLQTDRSLDEVCPNDRNAFFYLSNAEVALKGSNEDNLPGALQSNYLNVENHETAVKIFSSYVGILPDFSEKYSSNTVTSIVQSINLDPLNPNHWLNIGIVLYSAAVTEEETSPERSFDYAELANEYFNRAYELKPDYLRSILVITQANLLYDRTNEALTFLLIAQSNFEEGTFEYNKIEQWRGEIVENEELSELFPNVNNNNIGDITNSDSTSGLHSNTISINDSIFKEIQSIKSR